MIIIMGSVGSGKTEQGVRLVKKLDCPRISTSQLLRSHPASKWHGHIQSGRLVDDHEIIALLGPALQKVQAGTKECILDGAPRSVPQASWLTTEIKAGSIKLTAIINLVVSDEVVLQRLKSRGREDDQKSVILKRLEDYHAITTPVLSYLEGNGIEIHSIDGEKSPEIVESEIDKILNT